VVDQNLDRIIWNIERTRNKAGCSWLPSGIVFGAGFLYLSVTKGEGWPLMFGVLFGLAGILFGSYAARIFWVNRRPEKAPLVSLLREHPEKVARLYDEPGNDEYSRSINVYDTDGRHYEFSVRAADVEGVMEILGSFAPNASVGRPRV